MPETTRQDDLDDSSGGLVLLFSFIVTALVIVAGIVAMAATHSYWAVGIVFVGELLLTGAVAVLLEHYLSADTAVAAPAKRKVEAHRHHRHLRPPTGWHRPALHH